jgi:hypothetical protein
LLINTAIFWGCLTKHLEILERLKKHHKCQDWLTDVKGLLGSAGRCGRHAWIVGLRRASIGCPICQASNDWLSGGPGVCDRLALYWTCYDWLKGSIERKKRSGSAWKLFSCFMTAANLSADSTLRFQSENEPRFCTISLLCGDFPNLQSIHYVLSQQTKCNLGKYLPNLQCIF